MFLSIKKGVSVGTKMLLGVIFIVLILGIFGVYLSKTLSAVRGSFSELNNRYSTLNEITALDNVNQIQVDAIESYLLSGDSSWISVYDGASLEFDLRLKELDSIVSMGQQRQLIDQFRDISSDLRTSELLMIHAIQSNDLETANQIYNSEYTVELVDSSKTLSDLRILTQDSLSELIQGNRVLLLFSENILVAFMIILIALITVVALGISFSISNSVNELGVAVRAVMDGDLTRRARVRSHDEIGQLAIAFNKMTQRLADSYKDLESKVQQKTAALQHNVEEMQETNDELEQSKTALVNVMEDLEEEKRHIAQSQARDEAILQSIGDGLIVINREAKILFINEPAGAMLGCTPDSCVNQLIQNVVRVQSGNPQVDSKEETLKKVLVGQKRVSRNDLVFVRQDNTQISVSVTATPILLNESAIGAVIIFRDITHEREVDRAKTEFVSLASHQLRGPLTSIRWNAEMLLDDVSLSKDQRQVLLELLESNSLMIDMVNKLLNISRIELGTLIIEPVAIDLRELTDQIIGEFERQIQEKHLKLTKLYPQVLPLMNVDPSLTRIIFQNLLSNAIKYTPKGKSISVSFHRSQDGVEFTVSDEGVGIPKSDQARIFEKMFRAENVREQQIPGNGLGLYMVHEIVEKSGGKIWFESELDRGTTFHVFIPTTGMKRKAGTRSLTE